MTTFDSVRAAVQDRWLAQWIDGGPARTPTAFENIEYEPVKDVSFARLTIRNGDGQQLTMGSNRSYRQRGLILIEIFTPAGKGTGESDRLVDAATIIFRGVTFGGITTFAPEVINNPTTEADWYKVDINFPYKWDEQL